MRIQSVDLNLLTIFEALMLEGSVTRAAKRIGLSQPAMSSALARARILFDDQLFVRARGEMQPTPRARDLLQPIGEALARFRSALEMPPSFRPETAQKEFQIATNEYAELFVLPAVVSELRKCAPGLTLRAVRTEYLFLSPIEQLQSAKVDLALGFFSKTPAPQSGLFVRPLFEDRFVCLVSAAHRGAGRRLDLRTFLKTPHVRTLYPRDTRESTIDFVLKGRGLSRQVAITVPHMLTAIALVSKSNLLAIAPERMARREARRNRLRILDSPIAIPNVAMVMAWHERNQFDPAYVWLRDLIERVSQRQSLGKKEVGQGRRARKPLTRRGRRARRHVES